jgi:hypothetical protein
MCVKMSYSGCLRVMNTSVTPVPAYAGGVSVCGLECGSAVISKEATMTYRKFHDDNNAWVAITNHHVVGGANTVMCNFHYNLTPFPAQVYKINPTNDLALLLIQKPTELMKHHESEYMVEGSPLTDVIGAAVRLVGYPLGTECQTVSNGHIVSFNTVEGNMVYFSDALCNPGNSGGPMLDCEGKLLGINTAIMNPGNVVTLSKPWKTVESLLTYIKHEQHPAFTDLQLTPQQEFDLRGRYTTKLHPDELAARWDKHDCGHGLSFADWFVQHAHNKPKDLRPILQGMEMEPCPCACAVDCGCASAAVASDVASASASMGVGMGLVTHLGPELIVFNKYFQTTPTTHNNSAIQIVYPAMRGKTGVMISHVESHEPVQLGDILVSVAGVSVDSYGRLPNGTPYFTGFKDQPSSAVNLQVARAGEPELCTVVYTYGRVKTCDLPLIHAQALTPFAAHPNVMMGGVSVAQMTGDQARQFGHLQYLAAPLHNELVFVVNSVHPESNEWIVHRIAPGNLMTHINFKPLSAYGASDKDVWSWVQRKMSREGVQHITVTYKCTNQEGVRLVHEVYAADNTVNMSM